MIKKIIGTVGLLTCLMASGFASAAIITTSTQTAFNDVKVDGSFDIDDYLNPIYDYTLNVNQFDDNNGLYKLVGAVITLNGFLDGFFEYENRSTNAGSKITGTLASEIWLSTSTNVQLVNVLPTFTRVITVGTFDGLLDFAGDTGGTVNAAPVPITASETVTITDLATLNLFLGSGTISLDVSGTSEAVVRNEGGLLSSGNGVTSAGTVEIYYQYELTAVSAPSSLMVLALTVFGFGMRARTKK